MLLATDEMPLKRDPLLARFSSCRARLIQPDEQAAEPLVAVITLSPAGPGRTTIHWRSTFWSKVPGLGGVYRRQLGKFLEETVDGLACAAARTPQT